MTATTRIRPSRPGDAAALFRVWRSAVLATHDFLSRGDFLEIERLVRDAYLPGADLAVAVGACGAPVGFLGQSGAHVDSLFVDPACHGRGVGQSLLAHARRGGLALTVDVNEQNHSAVRFYGRAGFAATGRSPTDGEGRPYPLLHMRLDACAGVPRG